MIELFRITKLMHLPQISLKGTEADLSGDYVTIHNFSNNVDEKCFPTDTTLLLGISPHPTKPSNGGQAIWKFDISKMPFSKNKKLVSANLRIVTFRTHTGIYTNYDITNKATTEDIENSSPHEIIKVKVNDVTADVDINTEHYKRVKVKKGHISINGRYVDNIDLVPLLPTGRYHGFNRLKPYPVVSFIKDAKEKKCELTIKIEVEPGVYWDIDEIVLDSLVVEENTFTDWFKNTIFLLLGALLGIGSSIVATIFA